MIVEQFPPLKKLGEVDTEITTLMDRYTRSVLEKNENIYEELMKGLSFLVSCAVYEGYKVGASMTYKEM